MKKDGALGTAQARDRMAKAKSKAKGKAKGKPKSKGVTCGRCGNTGHERTSCYTGITVDGVTITTKTWKYRPKAKAKVKKKRKTKSKAKAKAKAKKKRMKDFIEATTNYRDPFKPSSPPKAKYKKQFKGGKDPFR
jgi:hypothetical protein